MTLTTLTPPRSIEHARLAEIKDDTSGWRRWGPYVSDRAWGTVREDYSANGDAWGYTTYDKARSKAFRWGEDAICGWCDRYQTLLMAPAFWNGRDPHLKERLFGVTPHEGNHGEDVKEYYYYLDSTPTHSYMKFLYKYPQAEFPYRDLVDENRRRNGQGLEHELIDTGIFAEDRYFDIFVEHAKASVDDIVVRIEAHNRGPEAAPLHILPHLWFRNTWSWGKDELPMPQISLEGSSCLFANDGGEGPRAVGERRLYGPAGARALFTDNETHGERVFGPGNKSRSAYTKDGIDRSVVGGVLSAVNPASIGTRAALAYAFEIPEGGSVVLRLRLSNRAMANPLTDVDRIVAERRAEADAFYQTIHPAAATEDARRIQRQALAGLLCTKQSYLFDVGVWLEGDNPASPPPASRKEIRNSHWKHLNSMRVMTVPDKWEYPWFAAWDLAFHCVALALVDAQYAKDQLWVLLFEQFLHPNGQIPAYEWEFSDLNPPVHAWAVWRVYNMDRIRNGKGDRDFLERCFHKLLINFAWWVNKIDSSGNNIFEGGFLGLDNITVIDRSEKARDGSVLEQSDATGWVGMFCLNLMRIALELSKENKVYEGLASKFFQHYIYVASAMKNMGNREYALWDEKDGFFYDVLRYPDGRYKKFRVRSLVGLIPLFAVERLEVEWIEPFKEFKANVDWFLENRKDLVADVVHTVEHEGKITHLLTIVNQDQLRRLLERMHNSAEFLSDYGLRSLSKAHEANPFSHEGLNVTYEPAEAVSKLKGGNSNWRGPIWFPTSFLMIESLRKLGTAFGPKLTVSTPASGGEPITFRDIAADLAKRMISIFEVGADGRRPVFGGAEKFQNDPLWKDHLLFYEYFHGDNGAGIGASHQTGWTALVASLIDEWT